MFEIITLYKVVFYFDPWILLTFWPWDFSRSWVGPIAWDLRPTDATNRSPWKRSLPNASQATLRERHKEDMVTTPINSLQANAPTASLPSSRHNCWCFCQVPQAPLKREEDTVMFLLDIWNLNCNIQSERQLFLTPVHPDHQTVLPNNIPRSRCSVVLCCLCVVLPCRCDIKMLNLRSPNFFT